MGNVNFREYKYSSFCSMKYQEYFYSALDEMLALRRVLANLLLGITHLQTCVEGSTARTCPRTQCSTPARARNPRVGLGVECANYQATAPFCQIDNKLRAILNSWYDNHSSYMHCSGQFISDLFFYVHSSKKQQHKFGEVEQRSLPDGKRHVFVFFFLAL